ncbi:MULTISPECIES: IS5 family transposase [Actinosynnema]|uniref:IS5 family transposase n=1 Tax=Actinosynnema TaxID=40566 RepID=UPI0020A5DEE1|nr:IS5 family transposase [Actinosynnema pretiosum]
MRTRRYPTDLTDAQWAVVDPLLPAPPWLTRLGGRPEKHCRRQVVDAILHTVDNGIKWRALPTYFPPWNTVYQRFAAWELTGASQRLLDTLRDRARLRTGRVSAPSAGMIDSQSLHAAPTVNRDSRGYDAAKKVQGRKRHIVVDTLGLLIAVLVTPASIHDKRAALSLLRRVRDRASARLSLVWADTGYHGAFPSWAHTTLGLRVEVVSRPRKTLFQVLPRRWVVERSLAWITGHRRCARDYERPPRHHAAHVRWAMIRIILRRLA